jgi:PPK2 family polyphosphate:nucleotide phosphotransferase
VIKKVFGPLNAQGCHVVSFKVPTEEELAHDFLWRIHRHTPRRGELVVFNRSHYEDVLVVRVHNLVPESVWRTRFDHINHFERLLTDSDTILVKFYLHLSREEQEERLLEREEEVEKAWKLSVGDWQEREYWDAYTEAYEEALERCAAPHAPWHLVPADKKWFRNLAVADALVRTLRPYRDGWRAVLAERGEREKQALAEYRR